MTLRLPDGRDLILTVQATEDGAVLNEHGEDVGDDGLAHGDVSGDLRRHHHASQLIDAVTRPPGYLDLPLASDGDQEVDAGWLERRDRDVIDRAVDRLAPRHAYSTAADREWVDGLRVRAGRAAEATRGQRLASAQHLAERLAEDRAARTQTKAAPRPDPDKAQAATVDHSLFAPSSATSAERAYVALSRGRGATAPPDGAAPSAGLGMEV